ncbi:MAG: alanine--tRNA ligase [Candidatus Eisenbacteria bacterium]|nr:alanine--tRNA ligase [Candidatus Eisenbacteria bacterium]
MGKTSRWTSDELRRVFLEFFRERGHPVLPPSPLAPQGDPTLLFTSAGMVQFKPYYVAVGPIPHRRAATVQPCLRGSDLENVGVTSRHHTFFEMLGNFSFGDYFKEEAIAWAWEFSTEVIGLSRDRLWISVFEEDDETARIWERGVGVDPARIVRLGAKDNFWGPAGGSGPCGPCSELYVDLGPERGCGLPTCAVGCDCDRYLEYWNLVFPQFNQDPDGNRTDLPNRGVDTGMGLERLAQILQEVPSNYDTDLFTPILEEVRSFARGVDPAEGEALTASRIVADHARALVFAFHEGIQPGNEGRGYVLRRILRRAVLRARVLGVEEPFLDRIGSRVTEVMSGAYPELLDTRERVAATIRAEEERFRRTLEQGLEIFQKTVAGLRGGKGAVLPGEEIFRLYDTYGFPAELTEEMARAEGIEPDRAGFEKAMEEARGRSRWEGGGGERGEAEDLPDLESTFVGYERREAETRVAAILRDGVRLDGLGEGEEGTIVLDESPFYGESGGQVGDQGRLEPGGGGDSLFTVRDTRRSRDDKALLAGRAERPLRAGEPVRAVVDAERRAAIARNHTATHLLHGALREVLGDHVRQSGSLVAPDRLRFDFVHYERTGDRELARIEALVNRKVQEDLSVRIETVSFAEARRRGATALFGEKYGETVRLVEVEGYSRELCGGIHVGRTGQIGPFLIVSEEAVGSGVRRIEALTGAGAYRRIREDRDLLERAAGVVRSTPEELPERVEALQERVRRLEKELLEARKSGAGDRTADLLAGATPVGDLRVIAAIVPEADPSVLKDIVDRFQEKGTSLVAVLGTRTGDKAFVVGMVSRDVAGKRLSAGDLIREVSARIGGRGGGKPTFAQGGGGEPDHLEEALAAVPEMVRRAAQGG